MSFTRYFRTLNSHQKWNGRGKQKKTSRTEVKFKLLFIIDVYKWAVLWFPAKRDGLFGVHDLRQTHHMLKSLYQGC